MIVECAISALEVYFVTITVTVLEKLCPGAFSDTPSGLPRSITTTDLWLLHIPTMPLNKVLNLWLVRYLNFCMLLCSVCSLNCFFSVFLCNTNFANSFIVLNQNLIHIIGLLSEVTLISDNTAWWVYCSDYSLHGCYTMLLCHSNGDRCIWAFLCMVLMKLTPETRSLSFSGIFWICSYRASALCWLTSKTLSSSISLYIFCVDIFMLCLFVIICIFPSFVYC